MNKQGQRITVISGKGMARHGYYVLNISNGALLRRDSFPTRADAYVWLQKKYGNALIEEKEK